ncbi:MAG TPA: 6,7-dimethyl-8-ribityllumazine synthase [Balneolales bacterium]|nr:6,7-dimethyl-8-ribityllumazine synthase [Balneolales bacterium]
MKVFEGSNRADGLKIGLVVSRWNDFITNSLREGALGALRRLGVDEENIVVAYCPGAYEIPFTAKALLENTDVDGVACLGAVIRGATPHFDYVCQSVNSGVSSLNLSYDKPVTFGVLTTETIEQAIERAGTKAGNKGEEAVSALIEMITLVRTIKRH